MAANIYELTVFTQKSVVCKRQCCPLFVCTIP